MTALENSRFRPSAQVVIIGGGVMGCGLAYHLAHEGWSDVILLEKAELTSGSTWHAAGQITHSTSSPALAHCVDYNIGLYSGALEAETGHSVTWHGCGSFRLAYDEDEMDWLRHTLSVGRARGFPMEIVGPGRIRELHPFYNLDGVLGALHTPEDGHADPSGIAQALAAGARKLGVTILRRCRATNIRLAPGGEWLVDTELGTIRCEHVVNAGGTYARQMGEWTGLQLPMTSMTHHYLVTDTVPEFRDLERELPVIRDDKMVSGYIRMEQKSGLIGIYEKANPNTVWEDFCPWEAENELFAADYDRIMPWLQNSMERMPIFSQLGIKREVHGAISHPPDGNPMIGPAPGAANYWCCCGTQIGIGWGPGLTRELARWMVHGTPEINMRDFDPRRFGDYATKEWQVIKAKEDYCLRHEIPFPHLNRTDGRPIKCSPLYETLKAKGAVYEEVYGHERPRWFARDGVEQKDHYSFGRTPVFDLVCAEVKAVREAAGIMDISAFARVKVSGAGAESFLDPLVPNRLPAAVGKLCLTHMLNEAGRIQMEVLVVRTAAEDYLLICAAVFEQRLLDHLAAHRSGSDVSIENLGTDWGGLALNGPKSREILAACTDAALDNKNFPWFSAQTITVAGHTVLALRMSFAGELGWELHAERDAISPAYDALMAAGAGHGLRDYGSFAMNVMRLEKGFPGSGELTNEVTLAEAAEMRHVRRDKDFVGRKATLQAADAPLRFCCVKLSIEPDGAFDGNGGEAVMRDGVAVGSISSIAYSPTAGRIAALAYVRPEAAAPGTPVSVVIAGKERAGQVVAEPLYDPESAKPRDRASQAVLSETQV